MDREAASLVFSASGAPAASSSSRMLSPAAITNMLRGPTVVSRDPPPAFAKAGDACRECRVALQVRGLEFVCPLCRAVTPASSADDINPVSQHSSLGQNALRARLRVVGPNARWFQSELDRSNPCDHAETQKSSTYSELVRLNGDFKRRGGNPFTLDILAYCADKYHLVQQHGVRRSMMKRNIYAALLHRVCIKFGFVRSPAEVAEFAQLPSHGIARGDDLLRRIDEEIGLNIGIRSSPLVSHVNTIFERLALNSMPRAADLKRTVCAIVECAEQKNIGHQSVLRSKAFAASYEVIRRSSAATKVKVSLDVFVERCQTRKATIRKFRVALADHASSFAPFFSKLAADLR